MSNKSHKHGDMFMQCVEEVCLWFLDQFRDCLLKGSKKRITNLSVCTWMDGSKPMQVVIFFTSLDIDIIDASTGATRPSHGSPTSVVVTEVHNLIFLVYDLQVRAQFLCANQKKCNHTFFCALDVCSWQEKWWWLLNWSKTKWDWKNDWSNRMTN